MMRTKQSLKIIILVIIILSSMGSIVYYLFVPEYHKSKDEHEVYIYVKDGIDYSMKFFEFKHNKQSTEKLVFKYIHTKEQEVNDSKSIIINIQYK